MSNYHDYSELFERDPSSLHLLDIPVGDDDDFRMIQVGDDIVIIDAGGELKEKYQFVLKMIQSKRVRAVFITCTHRACFNLLIGSFCFLKRFPESFNGCHFYLAGRESDWRKNDDTRALISALNEYGHTERIHYIRSGPFHSPSDLPITFEVFDNIFIPSYSVKATFAGQSIAFPRWH